MILGPIKTEGARKLAKNCEMYKKVGKKIVAIMKRKAIFFGHLLRMNDSRLTKRILRQVCELKAGSQRVVAEHFEAQWHNRTTCVGKIISLIQKIIKD